MGRERENRGPLAVRPHSMRVQEEEGERNGKAEASWCRKGKEAGESRGVSIKRKGGKEASNDGEAAFRAFSKEEETGVRNWGKPSTGARLKRGMRGLFSSGARGGKRKEERSRAIGLNGTN